MVQYLQTFVLNRQIVTNTSIISRLIPLYESVNTIQSSIN